MAVELDIAANMSRHIIMAALWFETALLPQGWTDGVRMEIAADGRIGTIQADTPARPDDEQYGIAVPGLGNVHSHAFQRGMAGLTEHRAGQGDNFWSWRELMYRFLDRLDPADVEAIAAQAFVEMLETGFTRVGEFHYLHHAPDGRPYANAAELAERIGAAAEATGIALTLLPVFYAHGDFDGAPPTPGQRRFLNDLDGFGRLLERSKSAIHDLPDAQIGIAPHSLRAITPDELAALLPMMPHGPIHIHAAEQVAEIDACLAWSGKRPVEWLLDNAPVDGRWCLIHATHLSNAESSRLAASGAVAGLCPLTEANLGDGIFPALPYRSAGGRIAIGTDSNILIDAAQELRLIEYVQRLGRHARNLLGTPDRPSVGATLFQAALDGGTQALGVEASLKVGNPADIVALDPEHPSLVGRKDDMLIDGWIFAARTGAVDTVWRRGCIRVSDGRHHRKEEIGLCYSRAIRKLLS